MCNSSVYNSRQPAINSFVGYNNELKDLKQRLKEGCSFAVIGGRRMGKTSFLKKLEKDLTPVNALASKRAIPYFLDMLAIDDFTTANLYKKLYNLVVNGISGISEWENCKDNEHYDNFIAHIKNAKPHIEKEYGDNWYIVFLIDEIDRAANKLPNDYFFAQLRNLLTVSELKDYFCIVVAGVNLNNLTKAGSPFNNILIHQYLHIFNESEARELVKLNFASINSECEKMLFNVTGRHPFLMQAILEKIRGPVNVFSINEAVVRFLKEHTDFKEWLRTFSDKEITLYYLLSESPDNKLDINAIRQKVSRTIRADIDDLLLVLKYHGIIEHNNLQSPRISSTMFKDWFKKHCPYDNIILPDAATLQNEVVNFINSINSANLQINQKQILLDLVNTISSSIKSMQDSDKTTYKTALKTTTQKIYDILNSDVAKTFKEFYWWINLIVKIVGN